MSNTLEPDNGTAPAEPQSSALESKRDDEAPSLPEDPDVVNLGKTERRILHLCKCLSPPGENAELETELAKQFNLYMRQDTSRLERCIDYGTKCRLESFVSNIPVDDRQALLETLSDLAQKCGWQDVVKVLSEIDLSLEPFTQSKDKLYDQGVRPLSELKSLQDLLRGRFDDKERSDTWWIPTKHDIRGYLLIAQEAHRLRGVEGAIRILDVGGGSGFISALMAEEAEKQGLNVEIVVIDPDEKVVEEARQAHEGLSALSFEVGNAQDALARSSPRLSAGDAKLVSELSIEVEALKESAIQELTSVLAVHESLQQKDSVEKENPFASEIERIVADALLPAKKLFGELDLLHDQERKLRSLLRAAFEQLEEKGHITDESPFNDELPRMLADAGICSEQEFGDASAEQVGRYISRLYNDYHEDFEYEVRERRRELGSLSDSYSPGRGFNPDNLPSHSKAECVDNFYSARYEELALSIRQIEEEIDSIYAACPSANSNFDLVFNSWMPQGIDLSVEMRRLAAPVLLYARGSREATGYHDCGQGIPSRVGVSSSYVSGENYREITSWEGVATRAIMQLKGDPNFYHHGDAGWNTSIMQLRSDLECDPSSICIQVTQEEEYPWEAELRDIVGEEKYQARQFSGHNTF